VFGPWRGKAGFPYTETIPASARLPVLAGTEIHYPTLIIGVIAAVLIYLLIKRTKLGYEIRVIGENPKAAAYAGISSFKVIMVVMIISGGLAGLAGAGELTGFHHMLKVGIDGAGAIYAASYGYIGIIVAWLGRRNVLGSALAAFFLAGILVGTHGVQIMGIPFAIVSVLLGLLLLGLIGGAILASYKIAFRGGR